MSGPNRGILRPHHTKLAFVHRLIDVLVIVGSLPLVLAPYHQSWHDYYGMAALAAAIFFMFFAGRKDLYRSWRVARIKDELAQLAGVWLSTITGLLLLLFITQTGKEYPRDPFITWFVVVPVLIGIGRVALRFTLNQLRHRGYNTRKVAILGVNDIGSRVGNLIHNASWMGLNMVGYFDDRDPKGDRFEKYGLNTLTGRVSDLVALARSGDVDTIYVSLPLSAQNRINQIIEQFSDTTVSLYYVPDFFVFDLAHARWQTFGEFMVVSVYGSPFFGVNGWLKRLEDIVLSSCALIVLFIPMTIIAIGIKMTSPGRVIFRQRRYGINGQEIEVWKFRTMTVCEDGPNIAQASNNDARFTPLGKFLRRTSLDELPQFINVLHGKMSVIGPRPHAVAHNEQYRRLIKGYMLRHKVKPGITGWAQINGFRGETDTLDKMEKRIEHDLEYIRNWSLTFDLKILALTILRGFVHKNAY